MEPDQTVHMCRLAWLCSGGTVFVVPSSAPYGLIYSIIEAYGNYIYLIYPYHDLSITDSALEYCNSTFALMTSQVNIAILQFSDVLSMHNITVETCNISIETGENFTIGMQLVTRKVNLTACDVKLEISTGNSVISNCLSSMRLNKEQVSSGNVIGISVSATREVNVFGEVSNASNTDISVLVYTFLATSEDTVCSDLDTQLCHSPLRCVDPSLLEYIEQYDICQTVSATDDYNEKDEKETPFLGVAVFGATLVFLLAILIGLQIFHGKSFLGAIRALFCMDEPRVDNVATDSNRPHFTLDAPPPSYSDLCPVDNSQNSESGQSQFNASVQTEISAVGDQVLRRSTSGVSNTSTLPPSYSDVIIHEEKYHVHV